MSRFFRFCALIGALLLVVTLLAMSDNTLITQKVMAHLIMPAGVLWVVGFGAIFQGGLRLSARTFLLVVWLIYSLTGSPYVGVALLGILEERFIPYEQPAEKLDALVLLGGGTLLSPGGRPALGNHGDRIVRPATLYHAGLVGMLITTGRSITEEGADRLLSRETAEIWKGLGVAGNDIIEVPEPRNTREELAAVGVLMAVHPEWKKVGLSSSASHLERALKEARSLGLELVPVPSDFRSSPLIFSPLYLVPQGRGFRDVQSAIWEFLGMLM